MTQLVQISPPLLATLAVAVLLVVAFLAIGKVPLKYNFRNLTTRWRTTLVTALASRVSSPIVDAIWLVAERVS